LHLDDAGAEVLALLRAHFDDCKGMRMVAMYGSGAFKQISETEGSPVAPAVPSTAAAAVAATTSAEAPMLDLIFAVDDPVAFHLTNMRRHPSHYSFLRHLAWLSPSLIGRIQEWSAGVWYNTLIDLPIVAAPSATAAPGVPATRLIKYGVISTKRLVQDLTTWDALYIAGRMHKPVSTQKNQQRPQQASPRT
jgi:translocator assembly and maintenance protein 41